MSIYEVFQCPKCKEDLDLRKSRLNLESLVAPCPECKEEFVVMPVAMCDQDFCKQKATHLSFDPIGRMFRRCSMHAPYDKETCPCCEAKLTYTGPYTDKDGNTPILITRQDTIKLLGDRIILTCPSCKKNFPIRTNVRCQDCSAPATTFKWVLASPAEWIVNESVLRINCNEHAKNCFIATACCGTPDHYIVCQLSQFRDEHLLRTGAGRFFVKAYERWSPPIARIISRFGVLKLLTRLLLRPITFVIGIIWGCQSENTL